jgi:hypothetical protein
MFRPLSSLSAYWLTVKPPTKWNYKRHIRSLLFSTLHCIVQLLNLLLVPVSATEPTNIGPSYSLLKKKEGNKQMYVINFYLQLSN